MKSSCIRHPQSEPLIIIRAWQLRATSGNRAAASLLSFFEYWHNIKIDQSTKNREHNDIAERHGDQATQDISLYQFHSADQLEAGILIFKKDAIRDGLKILEGLGFISIHKNPNPRYKFDNTKHFLFHPDVVNGWLDKERIPTFLHPQPEDPRPSTENRQRSLENRQTIPETTSEITPDKKIKEIPQTPFEDFPRFDRESGSGGREVISFSKKEEERYSPPIQIEPPRRASKRLEYPDTMVDPLMRQTMPSRGNFERVENPEFSSMRFEEFWQYSVPTGARRNKGEAKRQFMAISGIDYKTFKTCYEKAVKAYQDKNPKEKPDEKFRFFKGLGRWIEDEEWIDFVPEHSRGGSVNLEIVLKGLPRIFRRETYVILPDGDWRINMAHCNALEHAEFSRGNYIPERHRQIWDMKDFLEKNPDCIQLAEIDG
jgi:hypothetical protein